MPLTVVKNHCFFKVVFAILLLVLIIGQG